MNKGITVDSTRDAVNGADPYMVYTEGGMFYQHELAGNVLFKEADILPCVLDVAIFASFDGDK